ncbi:MAG: nitroreductase family protein [Lachnospiraceae bacterium]|nr:nitroreductase family protein [Lachnospiraceae bacterium]
MNLYEAIFYRQSVRNYSMTQIAPDLLRRIGNYYSQITPLFPGIETEIGITENPEGKRLLTGLFPIQAPYYLTIYTEEREKSEMNAGYIGEQLCLYMTTLGLGTCFIGNATLRHAPQNRNGLHLVIVIAFGLPKGAMLRRPDEAKRLRVQDLCVYKDQPTRWMTQVIEAARMAPSSENSQPWRFVVVGSRIHIFSKKDGMDRPKKWAEFNFGVMFSHIAVASEELWLEVDLIRLENVVQKNFRNNQYVLSAIVNPSM